MSRWNKLLTLVAVIGLTFVIVNVNAPKSHGSGGPAVTVLNTPLPVTGTVGITGPIAATITGTVGLSPGSSISVNNPTTQPIPSQDAGAFQPVSFKLDVFQNSSSDTSWTVDGPTVPAGKRLVVDDISAFGLIPANSALTGVWLVNKGGDNYLLVNPEKGERAVSSDGTLSIYGYNRVVKGYYNAGDVIETQLFRDAVARGTTPDTGLILLNIYVHGYYANVP